MGYDDSFDLWVVSGSRRLVQENGDRISVEMSLVRPAISIPIPSFSQRGLLCRSCKPRPRTMPYVMEGWLLFKLLFPVAHFLIVSIITECLFFRDSSDRSV